MLNNLFSSDSWRVLDSFPLDYSLCFEGMSLKGDTYWLPRDKVTEFFLIKFDFTAERFVRLPLPLQSVERVDNNVLSVVSDEKLSVLHIDGRSNVMRIWVSNKVVDEEDLSWRSLMLGVFKAPKTNESNVAICSNADYDMFKRVYNDSVKASCFNWPCLITYVPSLVRIH
ncbi:hypothetical protein BRARA_E01493 [Brassica rapa]|uniref:F-box associated beta-propeller type 1 domain-containing protein n=1 Tax=Brassica campestris TaxID=3711 RepID=A0A397Z9V3_BRACM|nr:hypothetical protein BRARA_E01493 [Brassica rapa]